MMDFRVMWNRPFLAQPPVGNNRFDALKRDIPHPDGWYVISPVIITNGEDDL